MNERIQRLDDRAAGLKGAILSGAIDVDCLAKTASSLLRLLFTDGRHLSPGAAKLEGWRPRRDLNPCYRRVLGFGVGRGQQAFPAQRLGGIGRNRFVLGSVNPVATLLN